MNEYLEVLLFSCLVSVPFANLAMALAVWRIRRDRRWALGLIGYLALSIGGFGLSFATDGGGFLAFFFLTPAVLVVNLFVLAFLGPRVEGDVTLSEGTP